MTVEILEVDTASPIVVDAAYADVTETIGARSGEWPPVAMNRLIAEFAEFRPKLERATAGLAMPLTSVRLLTPVP